MMRDRRQVTMDGFVSQRPNRKVGGIINGEEPQKPEDKQEKRPQLGQASPQRELGKPARTGISRAEIDESLKGIDDNDGEPPKRRRRSGPEPLSQRKKWIKRALIAVVAVVVLIGVYVGVKTIIASNNVFQGSILDIFQEQPLKQDSNGRSNILLLGTSEDDPGHEAPYLTDSMMILSIDQHEKNAFMVSIPRDMEVKYGRACAAGYAGKINAYYNCIREGSGTDADREALKKEAEFIGNIVGMDIQYGVNVNYTVMREMVNAVGGSINITIESRDPRGQMDSNFDWKCGVGNRKYTRAMIIAKCPPRGHFIDYPNGPVKLDAEHALYLAQARGDTAPTYGFEQSNFDREKNQQKIIKALREKAVSVGVLTDFSKVSAIIDALGNNLRTTFATSEFRTLVSLARDIKSEDIKSISLVDGDDPVMNGDGNPSAGKYQFEDLRAFLKKRLSSDPVVREAAPIAVYNGSGVAGVAQTEADKLEAANYTVESFATAPTGKYPHYTLYQIGSGNAGTAKKLQQRYGVKITTGTPPMKVSSTVRFVLIVGPEPQTTASTDE